MNTICHAVLGADIVVIVGLFGGLVLLGWYLILVRHRPFTGYVVLLVSVLAFWVNKRDLRQQYCERESTQQEYGHSGSAG